MDAVESATPPQQLIYGSPSIHEPFCAGNRIVQPSLQADSLKSTPSSLSNVMPRRSQSVLSEPQNTTSQHLFQSTYSPKRDSGTANSQGPAQQPQVPMLRQRRIRAKSRTKTRLSDYHNYYAKYNQLADRGHDHSVIL